MAVTLTSQRTKYTRNEDIKKDWVLVDAEDMILGRLAAQIAFRLRGKHKATYSPHQDTGDNVIVVNAGKVRVTGRKLEQKEYHEHTGFPGGLNTYILKDKLENDPTYAIKVAVKRMLPKGPLGRKLLRNLRVYAGTEHGHKGQQPKVWEPLKK